SVDARGRRMLLSPFGWIWRLVIAREDVQPEVQRHEAFAGVYRAERTMVLRPETRFGSLHLVVVDEEGRPLPGRDAGGRLMWETNLCCAERDQERSGRRQFPPDDGMYRDLPAGRWRLSVYVGVQFDWLDAYPRGIHERDVVIEDARTTEVQVVAKAAGLAGFRLRPDREPPGGRGEEGGDVKVQSGPDGDDVPFHVYDPERPHSIVVAPGVTLIGKPSFPPGRRAFLVTAKGYQPVRCEVEIAADKLVEVDVELVRQ